METKFVTWQDLDLLVEALNKNQVISFPTETVYGLGIIYDSKPALQAMKWAKKRPENKPFTLMVSDPKMIKEFAIVKEQDQKIISALMPGPITLILKRQESIDPAITNGYETIGVRCPDDVNVRTLIQACGKPLLVPSANISGQPPAKSSDEVYENMNGRLSLIVKGQCGSGLASTIVDLTGPEPKILRQGKITLEKIKEVLS